MADVSNSTTTWQPHNLFGWIVLVMSACMLALAMLGFMNTSKMPLWMPLAMLGCPLMALSVYFLEHKKIVNYPILATCLIGLALFLIPRLIN
ncbi:hypothetical protein J4N45_09845 [Vibrio sp. SCSIO 43140]|uniref:hypothetical protein n=1 Tax=Vibrio sp. SCSIO 43140 TaxID=2819100 RepID=UPI00207512D3|nr:hypothetical protein [Vibrio sp. SCSIO 43140]USD58830.1 hypothetical protein J4N45_09845 [Vibrio sp. SCSIO 43140]